MGKSTISEGGIATSSCQTKPRSSFSEGSHPTKATGCRAKSTDQHAHVTAHIRKASAHTIDIQKRLFVIQLSYHPHLTKWYVRILPPCRTTQDANIDFSGTRSYWRQEAKEEVVEGQGYAPLLTPAHNTPHTPRFHQIITAQYPTHQSDTPSSIRRLKFHPTPNPRNSKNKIIKGTNWLT